MTSRATALAAVASAALLIAFAVLQLALAAGAPLGRHVWGGLSETAVLSTALRVSSLFAAIVLTWMATVVVARAGLIGLKPVPQRWLNPATWAVAGYMALNTVGNFASTTAVERFLLGPGTAVISVLVALVAFRGSPSSSEIGQSSP